VTSTSDQRPDPRHSRFLERLRARPLSSWSHGQRYAAARRSLGQLAEWEWAAAGRPGVPPEVPDLGAAAIADQLSVLVLDAQRSGVDPDRLTAVLGQLADELHVRFDGRR